MSISVLRRARFVLSVMAVTAFSALVLVGCNKAAEECTIYDSNGNEVGKIASTEGCSDSTLPPPDIHGGGNDWNGSYMGDLWVDGEIDDDYIATAVVSGGNTINLTRTGVDVTLQFGALSDAEPPSGFSGEGYNISESYAANIEGGGVAAFLSGSSPAGSGRMLIVDVERGGETYHFVGGKQ